MNNQFFLGLFLGLLLMNLWERGIIAVVESPKTQPINKEIIW